MWGPGVFISNKNPIFFLKPWICNFPTKFFATLFYFESQRCFSCNSCSIYKPVFFDLSSFVSNVHFLSRLGPKKQDFWLKISCSQMKLPNFVNPSTDSSSKIWHDFSDKGVQKLKLSKKYFCKIYAPKRVSFNKKKTNQKDSNDHRKYTLKVRIWHFLTTS